ncbi:MAG TPA: M20 family peptidase [Aeromonadales bacterium]|nr:M20 family peptidase [Aeromonadales bacterium]
MRNFSVVFSLLFLMTTFSLAGELSPEQIQLKSQIEKNLPYARTLLEKVVNINSGTMNFTGVRKVGKIFSAEFRKLGFKTKWLSGDSFNRAGHLFAENGHTGPKILFIGHLDTVFAKDSPNQKYITVDERFIKGPGITDMKGGDVIIVTLLKVLKQQGLLKHFQIRVILMGDEEKRGLPLEIATKALIEGGKWADVALGFEDGDGNPATAVISRRGSVNWHLNVKGVAAHSSQIFQAEIGDGAIFETARILNAFRERLQSEKNLTFNPGLIVGGTQATLNSAQATARASGKNNVIAQTTQVVGDIRAISPEQLSKAKTVMQNIVSQHLPQTSAILTFNAGYPPMAVTAGNKKLLQMYSEVSEELGLGKVKAVNPRNAGAADISFVAADVCMALDGLGLMGSGGHTVREVADMATLKTQLQRVTLLLFRLKNLPDHCVSR